MRRKKTFSFTPKSPEIIHLVSSDKSLEYIINKIGKLEYILYEDSFQFMVNTIIGQMLSSKVSDVISERMNNLCKGNISPETISILAIQQLRSIGLSNAKSKYIIDLATHILSEPDFFVSLEKLSDEMIIKKIMSIRGLGIWSSKMYLIFVLNRMDVLPYEDGAFRQAFNWLYDGAEMTNKEIEEKCNIWKPYSSIATRYFYKVLDMGLTKTPYLN